MIATIFVAHHEYHQALDAYKDRLDRRCIDTLIEAGEMERDCIIVINTELKTSSVFVVES